MAPRTVELWIYVVLLLVVLLIVIPWLIRHAPREHPMRRGVQRRHCFEWHGGYAPIGSPPSTRTSTRKGL
jgi:hypothetical protein